MEPKVSEIIIDIPVEKKTTTCLICLDNDLETKQMFSVDSCGNRFSVECVKRYVEVGLLEGSVLRCPHYQCESMLSLISCLHLLTPKLRDMWKQRIEESIPLTERIYCPNPKCSVLMSKNTALFDSTGVRSCCIKCGEPFCRNCKVPWHINLSCDDYKRLDPNPNDIMFKALANKRKWRQCGKCQHMIECSQGCNYITCRCGYKFCYTCGAQGDCACAHQQVTVAEILAYYAIAFGLLIIITMILLLILAYFKIICCM